MPATSWGWVQTEGMPNISAVIWQISSLWDPPPVGFLKAVTRPSFHETHSLHEHKVYAFDNSSVNMNTGIAI